MTSLIVYCRKCCRCDEESENEDDPDEVIPLPPGIITPTDNDNNKEVENVDTENISPDRDNVSEELRRPQIVVRKQLFAMTGWNIVIYPNKRVKGTRELYSVYALLEVRAVRKGEVQMKGAESGLYLAMNRRGRLYGERDEKKDNTIWVETLAGAFFSYLSKKYAHLGWYLGIKKSGKPKRAHKTRHGQRAVQFLPRHPYPL